MTLAQLLQLYAPLAGMLGLAFWVGMLSERVRGLKDDVAKLQDQDTVADAPAVVRMETRMGAMEKEMAKFGRGIEGIQRQLANLMGAPAGSLVELKR